jgi:hypothetical protein
VLALVELVGMPSDVCTRDIPDIATLRDPVEIFFVLTPGPPLWQRRLTGKRIVHTADVRWRHAGESVLWRVRALAEPARDRGGDAT